MGNKMNTKLKKALYENIMKNVSKQVKKALNESNEKYYVDLRFEYNDSDYADSFDDDFIEDGKTPKTVGGPFNTYNEALTCAIKTILYYIDDDCGLLDSYFYIDRMEDEGVDISSDEEIVNWLFKYKYLLKNNDSVWETISPVKLICDIYKR